MTTMEDNQVVETAMDSVGSRVIEAFLSSGTSAKLKRRLINKYVLKHLFILLGSSCLC